jgi:mRNA-degrading endonuclease RelE of RelBE toxin-antitoxin system
MDQLKKFLRRLTKKKFDLLKNKIFPKIKNLDLTGLDVKPMKGLKGLYRVKIGDIRIIFFKDKKHNQGIIIATDFRQNIYKKFQ